MAHADSFIISIAIASMHRLNDRILDVSNEFQNTNDPIHDRVCVIPPPYYLSWFGISHPNVTLNRDNDPFCLHCTNGIQGTKSVGRQWNRLLDTVITILKYKKRKIDHAIYIKVFADGTVSYITVSIDNFLNTTNNDNTFTETKKILANPKI